MTWTTFNFAFGAVLTSSQMNNLYANFASFAAKDANAPVLANGYITAAMFGTNTIGTSSLVDAAVTTSKIAAANVTQSRLGTASGGGSAYTFSGGTFTLPGGLYGFYPQSALNLGSQPASVAHLNIVQMDSSTAGYGSYVSRITAVSDSTGTQAGIVYWQQTYITASPPYNLGDGDIPLFVFVLVDINGKPHGTYVAQDPQWAYNGPTNITPSRIDAANNKFVSRIITPDKLVARLGPLTTIPVAMRELSPPDFQDLVSLVGRDSIIEIPLTHEIKNADMPLLPSPFLSYKDGLHSILLDPVSTEQLASLHLSGANISEMLMEGYLKVGPEVQRAGPPGVPVHSFKWANNTIRSV